MNRFDIAATLRRLADLIELTTRPPDGRFKSQAYRKAAAALESANAFDTLLAERRVTELPGVGKGVATLVYELATTGRTTLEEELLRAVPPGALELAEVAGLATIEKLAPLQITTIEELEAACVAEKVRALPGLGAKTEERLLKKARAAIARRKEPPALLRPEAFAALEPLLRAIPGFPGVIDVEVAGALRRGDELVTELEILVITDDPAALEELLTTIPEVVFAELPIVTLAPASAVRVHVCGPGDVWGQLRAVGPSAHIEALGSMGAEAGDEAAVYAARGLQVPPPELRDLPLSALLRLDQAPYRLVEPHDVLGLVHCHSLHSDGRSSILELATHAASLGFRYLTITDHSPTASYARGVTLDRLDQQWEEIQAAREATGIDILRGTESDILADGALDYPDWLLEKLDVVIISIHNRHQQDEAAMTRRLVRALSHPIRKIWGHPLGRLLRERPPIECHQEAIFEALVRSRTIVELNGDPKRMDFPPEWARRAAALGLDFVVSADAHAALEMRYVANAVSLARKAGLGPERILNTRPAEAFRARVQPS